MFNSFNKLLTQGDRIDDGDLRIEHPELEKLSHFPLSSGIRSVMGHSEGVVGLACFHCLLKVIKNIVPQFLVFPGFI